MSHQQSSVTDVDREIRQRIREYILLKFLPGEDPQILTDTTPLVSGGVIDSMNSLKVGLFLEKTFSIRIAPEELTNPENLETIPAIARLVASKLSRGDVPDA
jgi:acyl carrier protein